MGVGSAIPLLCWHLWESASAPYYSSEGGQYPLLFSTLAISIAIVHNIKLPQKDLWAHTSMVTLSFAFATDVEQAVLYIMVMLATVSTWHTLLGTVLLSPFCHGHAGHSEHMAHAPWSNASCFHSVCTISPSTHRQNSSQSLGQRLGLQTRMPYTMRKAIPALRIENRLLL